MGTSVTSLITRVSPVLLPVPMVGTIAANDVDRMRMVGCDASLSDDYASVPAVADIILRPKGG